MVHWFQGSFKPELDILFLSSLSIIIANVSKLDDTGNLSILELLLISKVIEIAFLVKLDHLLKRPVNHKP